MWGGGWNQLEQLHRDCAGEATPQIGQPDTAGSFLQQPLTHQPIQRTRSSWGQPGAVGVRHEY